MQTAEMRSLTLGLDFVRRVIDGVIGCMRDDVPTTVPIVHPDEREAIRELTRLAGLDMALHDVGRLISRLMTPPSDERPLAKLAELTGVQIEYDGFTFLVRQEHHERTCWSRPR